MPGRRAETPPSRYPRMSAAGIAGDDFKFAARAVDLFVTGACAIFHVARAVRYADSTEDLRGEAQQAVADFAQDLMILVHEED